MTQVKQLTRRKFLKYSAASAAMLLIGPKLWAASPEFVPDVEIKLTASTGLEAILPGKKTSVSHYRAQLIKGLASTLQTIAGSYLGPIIRINKGQKIRVHFENKLAEESIIHWHGLHIPDNMDGHPQYAIGSGKTFVYEFEVKNRAGTYWFHPHPHGKTGSQVYAGLAGLFIVSDKEEQALTLPSAQYDIPLVIQDRNFDRNNQWRYTQGMMDRMMGIQGEKILVNGNADFVLPVETRPYRLRLLNGSNSRIYKLAWSDKSEFTVIGTDGGLIERPITKSFIALAPAERVELWVDFSGKTIGSEVTLQSLSFDDGSPMGRMGMMSRMMGKGRTNKSKSFNILSTKVVKKVQHTETLPALLTPLKRLSVNDAINAKSPRRFDLTMNRMNWGINNRTFKMNEVASNERVKLGTSEVWDIRNVESSGMMGMRGAMPHPIHIHGLQFLVIERSHHKGKNATAWNDVKDGYIDDGWKDTVLLMPGERVKVLLKFEDYKGKFLYHCHNLEHEDRGMMRNYQVT
ncbi:Multicopper oxidase [hydrothermal vent metagenome]|uniref:Multicopper oxidase CueO n=1 Tax=hydrothermal vent metagenome TaxID=652676 RepID=A0A3B0XUI8_9ZZZZ